uniref:Uncharacterized protein LOC101314992 isoform X2 n=1 Tax=Rhizophora mucronata TaxID=61149 RepID=A0A2P2KTN9_RHIMU
MAEVVPLPICSTIQPNWHCNNRTPQFLFFFSSNPKSCRLPFPTHTLQLSLANPYPSSSSSPLLLLLPVCRATKSQSGGAPQVSKRLPSSEPSANSQKKKKTKRKKKKNSPTFADNLDDDDDDVKIVRNVDGIDDHDYDGDDDYKDSNLNSNSSSLSHRQHPPSMPLPKPPAGFVVDDTGRVLMASTKRIAAIVDPSNNSPLECIIRRVFRSSRGDKCMLLCPVDTPVQMLKSTNIDGWSAVCFSSLNCKLLNCWVFTLNAPFISSISLFCF